MGYFTWSCFEVVSWLASLIEQTSDKDVTHSVGQHSQSFVSMLNREVNKPAVMIVETEFIVLQAIVSCYELLMKHPPMLKTVFNHQVLR